MLNQRFFLFLFFLFSHPSLSGRTYVSDTYCPDYGCIFVKRPLQEYIYIYICVCGGGNILKIPLFKQVLLKWIPLILIYANKNIRKYFVIKRNYQKMVSTKNVILTYILFPCSLGHSPDISVNPLNTHTAEHVYDNTYLVLLIEW